MSADLHGGTPDAQVHRLRIQCKKLRHSIDLFAPLFDRGQIKDLIKSLKQLQDNLGRFNDYSVQQLHLRHFLESRTGGKSQVEPEMIAAVGALIAVLHRLQVEERHRLEAFLKAFVGKPTRQCFARLSQTATSEKGNFGPPPSSVVHSDV